MSKFLSFLSVVGLACGFACATYREHKVTTNRTAQVAESLGAPQRSDDSSQPNDSGLISDPLRWEYLQSTSYADCIRKLRKAGCPEGTIRDILKAAIESSYSKRFAELNHRLHFIADFSVRLKTKMREEAQLHESIDEILYKQLGLQRPVFATALFTADEENRIAEARDAFPNVSIDPTDSQSLALAASNRIARIQYLASQLSPEKLTYYKLDREADGMRLDSMLRGMNPSKDEFLAVYAAVGEKDLGARNGTFSPDVEQGLQNALTPERDGLLHRLHESEFLELMNFAALNRLSNQTTDQLIQLRLHIDDQQSEPYVMEVTKLLKDPKLINLYLHDSRIHTAVRR